MKTAVTKSDRTRRGLKLVIFGTALLVAFIAIIGAGVKDVFGFLTPFAGVVGAFMVILGTILLFRQEKKANE